MKNKISCTIKPKPGRRLSSKHIVKIKEQLHEIFEKHDLAQILMIDTTVRFR